MAICNLTGMIAIYNENLNLFMSPYADGPIQFTGLIENNIAIDKITKYGRNFSIVRVPYAFKLLMQELSAMNINIRVLTDDNIDNLSSMSFSGSIDSINNLTIKSKVQKTKSKQIKDEPTDKRTEDSITKTVGEPTTDILQSGIDLVKNTFFSPEKSDDTLLTIVNEVGNVLKASADYGDNK